MLRSDVVKSEEKENNNPNTVRKRSHVMHSLR